MGGAKQKMGYVLLLLDGATLTPEVDILLNKTTCYIVMYCF
jgi:hypothetical protein